MMKKSPPPHQNIYQQQSKQTKNGEAHGGVMQDKYADSSVRGASDQPVTRSTPRAYARKNPDLTSFVAAIEQWLSEAEEGQAGTKARGGETTRNSGRGGRAV